MYIYMHTIIYNNVYVYIYIYIYIYIIIILLLLSLLLTLLYIFTIIVVITIIIIIRRPRPWPRQGRRLGPPQVWNFSFLAFQGRLPALKSHRLNIPLACFILQPTGTPRPHINGFLWASKPAVCQPLSP